MAQFWNEKRYHSLDSYLKTQFGEKIYKLSLNAGMTCPNRDGTLGTRGCIFCSEGGSGDFASDKELSITEQIEAGKLHLKTKKTGQRFIAYFQAYTNTYASITYLRKVFTEALSHPDIVILSIATRPDCIDSEVLTLLSELSQMKPIWIELGLQTIHEETAAFIRRGYSLSCFENTLERLHACNIPVIVHTILGLPNETPDMILETITYLSGKEIQGIKLQLLHILKNTDLADYYESSEFPVFTLEEYTDLIVSSIELLPPSTVIHRITGDGPKNILIAPAWSTDKRSVLNTIHKKLASKDSWQGKYSRHS